MALFEGQRPSILDRESREQDRGCGALCSLRPGTYVTWIMAEWSPVSLTLASFPPRVEPPAAWMSHQISAESGPAYPASLKHKSSRLGCFCSVTAEKPRRAIGCKKATPCANKQVLHCDSRWPSRRPNWDVLRQGYNCRDAPPNVNTAVGKMGKAPAKG